MNWPKFMLIVVVSVVSGVAMSALLGDNDVRGHATAVLAGAALAGTCWKQKAR
jgi:hypothetical protein